MAHARVDASGHGRPCSSTYRLIGDVVGKEQRHARYERPAANGEGWIERDGVGDDAAGPLNAGAGEA